MEFPFGRQTSKDSLLSKTEEAGRSLRSSITSGSSRLFDSVMSKKNGIFDGISSGITSTIDQVRTIGGGGAEDEEGSVGGSGVRDRRMSSETGSEKSTGSESAVSSQSRQSLQQQRQQQHHQKTPSDGGGQQPAPQPAPRPRTRSPVQSQDSATRQAPQPAQRRQQGQQPPSKPPRPSTTKPPPARPARPPAPSRGKANGSIRGQPGPGRFSRQQTAPADFDPSGTSSDPYNSEEAAVNRRQYSLRSGSVDLTHGDSDNSSGLLDSGAAAAGSNTSQSGQQAQANLPGPDITSTRISRNPFLDNPDSECTQVMTEAEVYDGSRSNPPKAGSKNPFSDLDPIGSGGKPASGSTLGTDLLPGIPRVPSNNTALLAPAQQEEGRDLLAITPTSGEALPMPSLEPTQQRRTSDDEIYDDSDADSVATEGCDEVPDPEDYGGADYDYGGGDMSLLRSGSMGSDIGSWHSNLSSASQLDDQARACRDFMKDFVRKIFNRESLSQSDKAQFGQYCQLSPGRLWFARYVNAQRANNKRVDEQVFYSLVQYFAVVLFECNEAEDFGPAKTLMNMCFTFYHEVHPPTGPTLKHFLYSYLKDQPIWQSLRFWNAAFFDAVQYERARKPVPTRGSGKEGEVDDRQYQENITFGQLGTFTCNMRAFGLSRDLCLEFLRKQSTIANLREEQVQMLRENVER